VELKIAISRGSHFHALRAVIAQRQYTIILADPLPMTALDSATPVSQDQ
tara:strand:- start:780 stop:926 length:147 start_codon:yes stop_codon:yes gene_type:complete